MTEVYEINGITITKTTINGIVTISPYVDGEGVVYNNLEKRYSDEGKMLLQVETGRKYAAAVDAIPCQYTYEETDEPIDPVEPIDAEYVQAAKIMLGEVD